MTTWVTTVVWAMLIPMATTDPLALLINYGLAGIIILLLVVGQLRTRAEVEAIKDASAREVSNLTQINAEQNRLIIALQHSLTGGALPAMARSTQILEALPQAENTLLHEVENVRREMVELVDQVRASTRDSRESGGGPGP